MKCPVDGETLVISDRSGVEIDYCPQCRGVWLDRGELDKIIERSGPEPSRAPRREARDWEGDDRPRRKKSRGGFLEDLFDF
ncbi:zf-TFIIB domain-containing protein [Roseovarius rhodophyticola]|uniref:Zf-TFIIB domain-containing protein n=1 Tax=Roseovarius rhodophyticola TaxID=3080827 RepID=A0ABZ2TFC5_9RHOB|nr:zf-TFIIB domain-containing protein [Roseovarius sp. W115]MDV2928647.1 zf-TFIIB domain-containing protein [Roseovarius sp. W115]